jgi:hypothetical protein
VIRNCDSTLRRNLLQFDNRCFSFVQVVKFGVIEFTFQPKAVFICIVYDVPYVSKETDNLWYATTQPLDCGCVAAKDNLKVSRIIAYNIQPTHFSVSSYSSVSSVPADRDASIGSQGFHHSHVQHHHHWDAKSEKEERGAVSIQHDLLQYELEAWKRMQEDLAGALHSYYMSTALSESKASNLFTNSQY